MDINKIFREKKERAERIFKENPIIYCPYFNQDITLNSDGLHHLQFSARRERGRQEQILKLNLLPIALKVIRKSGTVQQYRKELIALGKPSNRDGMAIMKNVQYWAFEAINGNDGEKKIKIRVIVRQIGNGKLIFWSVMLLETEERRLAKTVIKDD